MSLSVDNQFCSNLPFTGVGDGLLVSVEPQLLSPNHRMQSVDDVRLQLSRKGDLAGARDVVDQARVNDASFVEVGDKSPFIVPENEIASRHCLCSLGQASIFRGELREGFRHNGAV